MLQFSRMIEESRSEQIKVRVIRDGLEPADNDWAMASPEDRIEAVWTLTELCLAWHKPSASVPRLQRTITRLQRAQHGPPDEKARLQDLADVQHLTDETHS
jgi:hypothetical protein